MSGGANPFGNLFGGLGKGTAFGRTPAPTVADFTTRKWSQGKDYMGKYNEDVVGGKYAQGSSPHGWKNPVGGMIFPDKLAYRIKPKVGPKIYKEAAHLKAKEQWQFKEDMRQRKLAKMKELMDYGAKDLNQKMTARRPGATPQARSLVDSPMMPPNAAVSIMDPEVKSLRDMERKRYGRRYG
tara:strand:+ start:2209 stop:2754 length:546 start_codon:yes stop_codon:yes gene_type:complete